MSAAFRTGRRPWRVLGLAAVLVATLAPSRPPGLGDVAEVRHWSYPDYTRVVVELSEPLRKTDIQRLAANPAAGKAERLFVDLPRVWVGTRFDGGIQVGDGLLRGIRLGQFTPTTARLVVDLENFGRQRSFTLTDPERLVVDIYGSGRVQRPPPGRMARSPQAPPGSNRPPGAAPSPRVTGPGPDAAAEKLPLALRPVQTIVIDPGHGGEDPGALGAYRLREKDVTLAIALELRRKLRERGFQVFMTRDRDVSVSLEERTALAEGVNGDVFVSIHANAARRREAQGIETYILDQSHERHTLRVASRENNVPASRLDPLQRAMAGLRVSEVSIHSEDLARAVHGDVVGGVREVYGSVRDLGVKRGPFHVLFLSGSPSILVEVGFVTNPSEAKRLQSRLYRSVLAEHLARGLSSYRRQHDLLLAGSVR